MAVCEDLATKAGLQELKDELQELRDQLNAMLGKKEEGGTVEIFQADAGIESIEGSLAGTAYINTQERALEALVDIKIEPELAEPTDKDLVEKKPEWVQVKGSGLALIIPGLAGVGKVAGTGSLATKIMTAVGNVSGGGIAVLSSLTSIGASLGLNIATVNILDERIEAEARGAQLQIDAVNTSMLRLYDKQQGDIDAVIAELDANDAVVQQVRQDIDLTKVQVQEANRINLEQEIKIEEVNQSIEQLRQQNESLVAEINANQLEAREIIEGLTYQIETNSRQLHQAITILAQQRSTISAQTAKLEAMETRVGELENRIQINELQYIHLREEFFKLKQEIEGEIDIVNDRVTSLEGKTAKTTVYQKRTGGSGGLAAATTAQDGILKLASGVAGQPYQEIDSNTSGSFDRNTQFNNDLDNLLEQITAGGNVTPEQIEDLRTGITTGVSTDLSSLLSGLVVPRLDNIADQTTDRRQQANVGQGICQSLNGQGSCPVTPGNPNPTQGLQGMQQGIQAGQLNISNALGLANLGANQSILGIVQNTNSVINSSAHGLQAIQNFASTAWRVTKADKIMAGVSMALTVHNAMMLSNNLLSTMSEAVNITFEALNIRDETDEPIDFGKAVKDKINAVLASVLGQANYEALTARIAKANRIYQAGINILDTTYSLFDSARTVAELTAEHMGQIGNALREAGVVYEDAYNEMSEKINPQNAAMRKLGSFREAIEVAEDAFDSVSQISSSVVETKDNIAQLKTEKEELKTEIEGFITEQKEEKDEAKEEAQVTADINEADFDPAVAES